MVVPYSKFGTADVTLYRQYLLACVVGDNEQNSQSCRGDERAFGRKLGRGVGKSLGGSFGEVGCFGGRGRGRLDAGSCAELLRFYGSGSCAAGGQQHEQVGEEKMAETCVDEDRRGTGVRGTNDGVAHGLREEPGADSVGAKNVTVEDVDDVDAENTNGEWGDIVRGKRYAENRRKKMKRREVKAQSGVVGVSSVAGSVQTVDTRTGVEIEAAQTLAARRVEENKVKIAEAKVAAKLAEHRLKALNDKERSLVIDRLAAARLEEKINTAKQKSQASFKGCGSPIESVGSALSAHEFAFKQQVRKIDAQKRDIAYQRKQVEELLKYASPDVRRRIAEMPEPYIPSDEEMEAEDADQSPEPTYDEMDAEADRYFAGVIV